MAEKRITTPADTIQVISVGEIAVSSKALGVRAEDEPRDFFDWRSLEDSRTALRLEVALTDAGGLGPLDDDEVVGSTGLLDGNGGATESSPSNADSGTIRKVVGSTASPAGRRAVVLDIESRFGRPRAAAAHESNVERLARNAASWSGWYVCEGEIILKGVCVDRGERAGVRRKSRVVIVLLLGRRSEEGVGAGK